MEIPFLADISYFCPSNTNQLQSIFGNLYPGRIRQQLQLTMDVFSFDQRFFFHRQSYDDCWYVYMHPSLNLNATDSFSHGYFNVASGRFARTPQDGRGFDQEQIRRIESILSEHSRDMNLEQFEAHQELPSHYQELGTRTNRYSDLQGRTRGIGPFDPNFSVAFEQLIIEEPAYRLTREFVLRVLDRASRVSSEMRDKWLHEVLKDTWTYDVHDTEPGETFKEFYQNTVKGLPFPKPMIRREDTDYQIYEIAGLPSVYLFSEETDLAESESKLKNSWHYLDIESAVVPIPLPCVGGQASYIL